MKSLKKNQKKLKPKIKNKKPYKSNIKKYVKNELKRMIETKINDVESSGNLIYGYINDTMVRNLLISPAMGTGEGNRIGNKINCTNLTLRFSIYCYNQSTTTPPVYFDVYIFKMKTQNLGGGMPTSAQMLMFLEDGNSSKQYVGTNLDGMRYLNNDLFTLCVKKRISLYNPYSTAISITSSINPHRYFSLNLTKYIKKNWLFNDTSNTIENDNLYMAVGATLTNGSVLPIATLFGEFSYLIQAKYKDA